MTADSLILVQLREIRADLSDMHATLREQNQRLARVDMGTLTARVAHHDDGNVVQMIFELLKRMDAKQDRMVQRLADLQSDVDAIDFHLVSQDAPTDTLPAGE